MKPGFCRDFGFSGCFELGAKIGDILEKREVSFDELRGVVAVDAFNSLYQFLSIIRQRDGTPLMDSKGRATSHLSGLFYRTCSFLEKGVKPVFVFDGKPSILKARTVQERGERKQDALEKFKAAAEAGEEEEMRTYAMQTTHLNSEMIGQSQKLLELLGVPWVQAKGEGEAQCSHMCRQGVAIAACSQDFDSLLFGAPILVRNLAISGKRKLPHRNTFVDVVPERFDLPGNLSRLGISQKQLVWIGILSGTDFNKGVYGIGAKKALKLVLAHPDSFEDCLSDCKGEIGNWREVEKIFLHPGTFDVEKKDLEFKPPNAAELEKYMCGEFEFSPERVRGALSRAFSTDAAIDKQQAALGKWM